MEVRRACLFDLETPGTESACPGGRAMVAAQTLGTVEPATGVMFSVAVGSGACGARTKSPGSHETASTVTEVTEIVLPRVHAGNFEGEIVSVST